MRKFFTLMAAGMTLMAVAESRFTICNPASEGGEYFGFAAPEAISPNGRYAVGNTDDNYPCIWDVDADKFYAYIPEEQVDSFLWDPSSLGEEGDPYWQYTTEVPTCMLHAVNNDGKAVGSIGKYAVIYDVANPDTFTELPLPEGAEGEGYAISSDGKYVAGFWYYDDWKGKPCVWNTETLERTDLYVPNDEELDFPVDEIAEARYISGDGTFIGGYVNDFNGGWNVYTPACGWKLENGEYKFVNLSGPYYQTMALDEETWEFILPENPKPYIDFTMTAISENGEWIALTVAPYNEDDYTFDFGDDIMWSPKRNAKVVAKEAESEEEGEESEGEEEGEGEEEVELVPVAARMNLNTGEIEVLKAASSASFFGIDNYGNCVGRYGDLWGWDPIQAVVWPAGSSECVLLTDKFADDEAIANWYMSQLSGISAKTARAVGYAYVLDEEAGEAYLDVYVVDLNGVTGVKEVYAEQKAEGIYDLLGRKLNSIEHNGIYIINGEKKYVRTK